MGQILSQPETEKHPEKGGDKHLAYGLSCMQGWRINMEDAHATILNLGEGDKHVAYFGVYDGHGGEKTAIFTGDRLHGLIEQTEGFKLGDFPQALKDGFLLCDEAVLQDYETRNDESGCAATAAIITESTIHCGNAGDSRTVLSTKGYAKALSYDHKPFNEGEKARICAAGGYVDVGRVNGNLALSRGIGDFMFKKNPQLPAEEQIVTCFPEIISHDIDFDSDEFVILACDGIWDCLSSQQCVECVRRGIWEKKPLTQICDEIMELCCAPTSDGSGIGCDNMSILIVVLLDQAKGETLEQWYDKIAKRAELLREHEEKAGGITDSDQGTGFEYGPISREYNTIYKEIFGEYYDIGHQGAGELLRGNDGPSGHSMLGNLAERLRGDSKDDDGSNGSADDEAFNSGAISLQKLLLSNVITNENGVIYLDTSSAQLLLASFGMPAGDAADDDDDEDDSLLERHVEEVEDSEASEGKS